MNNKTSEINPRDRQFMGHPIGLWVLFTTEMWERFCYYGMRAFLVLYLVSTITATNPGFGWTEKGAYSLYGWFTGLVYFLPLFGGWVADRFIGQHRSVLYGGILIALGELFLFFTEYFRQGVSQPVTFQTCPGAVIVFFLGLILITVGTGFFKPCISVMVGQLYGPDDNRRDAAFTYFYMGINVGAFIAPFIAGTIAEKLGWHWGFLTASVGMVFGLITYSLFRPQYLGHIGMVTMKGDAGRDANSDDVANAGAIRIDEVDAISARNLPLTRKQIDRIAVIITLSLFTIPFWSVFEQAGSSLTTFAKRETDRQIPSDFVRNNPLSTFFIPNEDEDDAVRAFDEMEKIVPKAVTALDQAEKECQVARESLMTKGEHHPDFLVAVTDYHNASKKVSESLEIAENAITKANYARQKAGLEPLDLTIPTIPELLEKGLAEKERVKALAEERHVSENDILLEEAKKEEMERLSRIDPEKAIYTFPSTWYQSVNPLWIVVFAPIFAGLWSFLGKLHIAPSTPVKFGIGLVILSFAFLFMIGGAIQAHQTTGNAAPYWLLATYVFCTLGELCLSPVGLSMVTRLAPPQYASVLMGFWFLSSAVAGYLSGSLAAVFGTGVGENSLNFLFKQGLADYFLAMAILPLVAGLIMFALAPILRRMMHEDD